MKRTEFLKGFDACISHALSDSERAVVDTKIRELSTFRNDDTRRAKFEAWRHNSAYSNEVYKAVAKSVDI